MRVLITGGAGFIGSHLVDYLMDRGNEVRVVDNLSAGNMGNLERWSDNPCFEFVRGDLLNPVKVQDSVGECPVIYHLAANPEVRIWRAPPEDSFKQNIEATYNLLEAIRKRGDTEILVFTSSSTVYGEADVLPTPEDYAPLKPISHYGASKLAAEALISAYASMYGFRCVIYRMANVVGPRCSHGVIYDFLEKLRENQRMLEVLGDGTQSKSYLYINDCVEGLVLGAERTEHKVEILNIGPEDRVDVKTIANIVIEEMKLNDVEIRLTGGVDGGRGWKGDVKVMHLEMSRLKALGWCPQFSSAEAVRKTVKALIKNG